MPVERENIVREHFMSVFPKNYNLRCAKIMMFGGGGDFSFRRGGGGFLFPTKILTPAFGQFQNLVMFFQSDHNILSHI
jgi:hypothetical protein